jgi:hypothetical protein
VVNSVEWSITLNPKSPVNYRCCERFREFSTRIIAAPKAEIDEQEADYQRPKGRQQRRTKANQTILGDG